MKRIAFILSLPLFLSFGSCGGSETETTTGEDTLKSKEIDYTGMKSYDLNPHGFKSSIMVPEEISSTGEPFPVDVLRDDDVLTWTITVGSNYNLVIEEPDGEGDYIKREKERLKNDDVFTEEFITDEPDVFVYKATLPAGAGQRDYFHVFGVVKVNNLEFIVRSNMMGEFSQVQAEDMYKSIKSLTAMPA